MNEEIVKQWIKKAESDLKVVKNLLKIKDPPIDMLCRYPEETLEPSIEEAEEFYKFSLKIKEFVLKILIEFGLSSSK